tara:strand:+ start:640 stop:1026 length:387 start_codon:yes stop_codon:yes gene_type:complete
LQAVLHDFASLSLLQLLVLEQSEVEQQPPMQFIVEQELKKVPKLKTMTNDKIYFLIISPYFLLQDLPSATVVVLQHDVLESQLLIQHTALITPQVNTATKTTFKANSIPSFQQFQLSHFIFHSFICLR